MLLDVLAQKLDPKFTTCHMNKRCIKVLQDQDDSGKIALYFADGTEACTDVVLGADGIKSVVRGAVTAVDPWNDVTFSKTICYRALIPTTAIQAAGVQVDLTQRPVCFIGEDKVRVLSFTFCTADTGHIAHPDFRNQRGTDCLLLKLLTRLHLTLSR